MSGNDSSTGGPLLPVAPSPPLMGQALNRFIQQWLSSVSGLAGNLFYSRWQPEPPDIPEAGTAWAAFGIVRRTSDDFPYVTHFTGDPTYGSGDQLQRHETLELLCSFYDLGTNGQADFFASQLRDGIAIAQNLEPLELAGMNLVASGDLTPVPSLLKSRWLYRVDLGVTIRRAIARIYPILDVVSSGITIIEQDPAGSNVTIVVNTPPA